MLSNQPKPSVSINKIVHIEYIKDKHISDLDTLEKLLVKLLDKDIATEVEEIKYAIKKIRLKYIVICENLKISEIPALGFANPEMKTLIFNLNTENKFFNRVWTIYVFF